MPLVVFDPVAFIARYPEFSAVPALTLSAYFNEATLYLSNSDSSPVQNLVRRALLLNMLTAHVATLDGALSADHLPLPVGRVSNGTEGSVSAQFEYSEPGTQAWFTQTQYGAAFWQATINLRSFRYVSHRTRF